MLARKAVDVMSFTRRRAGGILLAVALALSSALNGPVPAAAVEVGERAPDFRLASTHGVDISLSDFLGKKFVLVEFYGADFSPT